MEMMRLITVGVILLFLGVAVAPGISSNVAKTSANNDRVEVTSRACGIPGFGNTTIKLTQQQYQDLEQYLVAFQAKLNQTTTREEAVPIFKDAIVELNTYGLLPKGMSVGQAQRFVSIGDRLHHLKNWKKITANTINSLCLFTAIFHGSVDTNLFMYLGLFLSYCGGYDNPLLVVLGVILLYYGFFKPLRCMNLIYAIDSVDLFFSIGADGIKKGHLDISTVSGFTGLKIILNVQHEVSFYLGFALTIT